MWYNAANRELNIVEPSEEVDIRPVDGRFRFDLYFLGGYHFSDDSTIFNSLFAALYHIFPKMSNKINKKNPSKSVPAGAKREIISDAQ